MGHKIGRSPSVPLAGSAGEGSAAKGDASGASAPRAGASRPAAPQALAGLARRAGGVAPRLAGAGVAAGALLAAARGARVAQGRPYHVDVSPTVVREDGRGVSTGHVQIVPTEAERKAYGLAAAYGHSPDAEAAPNARPVHVQGRLSHPEGTRYDFGTRPFPLAAKPFGADAPVLARAHGTPFARTMTRLDGPTLTPAQAEALKRFEHAGEYRLNGDENCVGGFAAAANAVLVPRVPLESNPDMTPQHVAAQALDKIPGLELDRDTGLGRTIAGLEAQRGGALTREQQGEVIAGMVTSAQFAAADKAVAAIVGAGVPAAGKSSS